MTNKRISGKRQRPNVEMTYLDPILVSPHRAFTADAGPLAAYFSLGALPLPASLPGTSAAYVSRMLWLWLLRDAYGLTLHLWLPHLARVMRHLNPQHTGRLPQRNPRATRSPVWLPLHATATSQSGIQTFPYR